MPFSDRPTSGARLLTAISLHAAAANFPVPTGASASAGGAAGLTALRNAGYNRPDVVLRFKADKACSLGDGTNLLGIYGIKGAVADLLGIVGVVLAAGANPSIPFASATAGFGQVVQGAALYDDVVIGGIGGTITPSAGAVITVTMLPIDSL